MKTLNETIISVLTEANKYDVLYHTSRKPIQILGTTPLFFAIEEKHAIDGWVANNNDEGFDSYVYTAKFTGNMAMYDDKAILSLFEDKKIDMGDYTAEIAGNPGPKAILKEAGTKLLLKHGYDALYYSDYDPRDFQNDLDAVIIFNPVKNLKGWKRVQ